MSASLSATSSLAPWTNAQLYRNLSGELPLGLLDPVVARTSPFFASHPTSSDALHIQKLEDHGRDITMPQHNVIADIDRAEDVRDLPADAAMKAFPKLLK